MDNDLGINPIVENVETPNLTFLEERRIARRANELERDIAKYEEESRNFSVGQNIILSQINESNKRQLARYLELLDKMKTEPNAPERRVNTTQSTPPPLELDPSTLPPLEFTG